MTEAQMRTLRALDESVIKLCKAESKGHVAAVRRYEEALARVFGVSVDAIRGVIYQSSEGF